MKKTNRITKFLAITGTILVSIPILAPIVFTIIRLVSAGDFQLDYLMPAEIGLLVLIGGVLLIWAAIRSRLYLKWIAWSSGVAVFLILSGQGLAIVTGLASGQVEATGWQFRIVMASIVGYDLAVIALLIGGILLCIRLIHHTSNNT
ncbi:hypothetical protein EG832_03185 [bacterium]|nr:hypothetical protein [bacterium]